MLSVIQKLTILECRNDPVLFNTRVPVSGIYAVVNGYLELTFLKDRQRFNAFSTSNLEVYKFLDWWILTYFIFGKGESSPSNIWSMVNLERTCVLLFYYFLCLKVNLDLEKTNQLGESSPNFIFAVVNLDPIVLEKRWIDGESWPNDFVDKVNRGENLRWVGSRCPLMHALKYMFSYLLLLLPTVNACIKGHLEPTHLKSSPLFNFSSKSLGQDSPSIHLFSTTIGSRFTTVKIKLGEDSPSWFFFSMSRFTFK